jgi:hypothetical protein
MATLSELADQDQVVHRIMVPLGPGKSAWRSLYGSTEFLGWLEKTLPSIPNGALASPLTPFEQVYALFRDYLIGTPFLDDRRFHALSRTPDLFVWEFKTPDIRIFGWFVQMDRFVCSFGDSKDDVEKYDRHGLYMAKTDYFRAKLDLDPPKLIEFKEYANVLSDAD